MVEAIDRLTTAIERQTVLLQQQQQKDVAKETKSDTSTATTESPIEKNIQKNIMSSESMKNNAGSGMMSSLLGKDPKMAAMMMGIDAIQAGFSSPQGTPGRMELEGAKYTKPREEFTQMAETIGMSGKVMSEDWWSMAFETKKAQRESVEQNVKNMQMGTALAPTMERDAQVLADKMYEMYEKLAGSVDGLYNKIMIMLG